MIRVASQFTFCSPEKILRRMVVEIDELNALTRLVDLDTHNAEPANTLFYDGILSAGIISVNEVYLSLPFSSGEKYPNSS